MFAEIARWWFGIGAVVGLASVLAIYSAALRKEKTTLPVAAAVVLVSVIGWPLIVWMIIVRVVFNPHTCGWCGKIHKNKATLVGHLKSCSNNPYAARAVQIQRAVVRLRNRIEEDRGVRLAAEEDQRRVNLLIHDFDGELDFIEAILDNRVIEEKSPTPAP